MTVVAKVLHYPELSYGQLSQGHTLRTTLPPGKKLIYTPPLNLNPQEYLAAGATAINVNDGVVGTNFNIGSELRGVCGNSDFIREYGINVLGGKWLKDWTEQEVRDCARRHLSNPVQLKKEWTSQAGEAYGENIPFGLADGSWQKRVLEEETAKILDSYGYNYWSQYRGVVLTRSFTTDFDKNAIEVLRPGFTNTAEALRLCRMSTADDYFWEAWKFRRAIITSYYSGNINPQKFFAGHLTDIALYRQACIELGAKAVANDVLGFGWYGEYQTMDQDVWHVTYIVTGYPDGGFSLHTRPPRYPMPVNVGLALIDLLLLTGLFAWESTLMVGTNKNYIYPNNRDIGNAGRYYGGSNPAFSEGTAYWQPSHNAGYAPHPLGYQDAPLVAGKWLSIAYRHAGLGNIRWCRGKRSSSNNFFSNDPSYVIDRYQQDQPWFLEGGNGSKGWLLVLDFSGTYGEIRDWDIDTSLGITSIRHASGTSRLYLLN
ncbi:hypothetical protein ACAW74_25645 [Fibrella sp. WM1]|uniref:hypothetical protein n=1 Tax=Fibrella musci TaxID=3242485 RepID=UPI00352012F6